MSWVSENVLVANPRDPGLVIKVIKDYKLTLFADLKCLRESWRRDLDLSRKATPLINSR